MKEKVFRMTKTIFNLGEDRISESEVVASISSDVEFRGAKLWLLIFAVFLASLGLNTNSTAVIIGAMLISPLMGPILGMGLGVAIYDFALLKKSALHFASATLFSIITATVYFLLTPISQAQSELLARTSPTIYDVCIALCGGLAGIIALCSRSQRYGNVLPGVAIATALMPPLCTVGYGVATLNAQFALGALYLYLINAVFIAFSTAVSVAFIFKFSKKTLVDKAREKRLRHTILGIALATMIPSVFLTLHIVQKTIFEQRATQFVQSEMNFPDAQVITHKSNAISKTIQVLMVGNTLDSARIAQQTSLLPYYGLEGTSLQVIQNTNDGIDKSLRTLLSDFQLRESSMQAIVPTPTIEDTLSMTRHKLQDAAPEIATMVPQIASIDVSYGQMVPVDSTSCAQAPSLRLVVMHNGNIPSDEQAKIEKWLCQRLGNLAEHASIKFIPNTEHYATH